MPDGAGKLHGTQPTDHASRLTVAALMSTATAVLLCCMFMQYGQLTCHPWQIVAHRHTVVMRSVHTTPQAVLSHILNVVLLLLRLLDTQPHLTTGQTVTDTKANGVAVKGSVTPITEVRSMDIVLGSPGTLSYACRLGHPVHEGSGGIRH
jgi:hypothetical protein